MGTKRNQSATASRVTLLSLCFGLLATGQVKATTFSYSKIADTNDTFTSFAFGNGPAINNEGAVAFLASIEALELYPYSSPDYGIFTGGRTTTTIIPNTLGNVSVMGGITNEGMVVFEPFQPNRNLVASDGTNTKTIIDLSNSPFTYLGQSLSNDLGTVAFVGIMSGQPGQEPRGIFTSDGTKTTTILPTDNSWEIFSINAINNRGIVAFTTQKREGQRSIFLSDGTITSKIAATGDNFKSLGNASLNDLGKIAFFASLTDGNAGIFTSDGITISNVVDLNSSPFESLGGGIINNEDTVVFFARLAEGDSGIYIGADPTNDKVIAAGDELFDSKVQFVDFSNLGFNDIGQVAFRALLEDGTDGIYVATPELSAQKESIAEPTSALAIVGFGVLVAGEVLKRQQRL
ncbi:MAG: choice-of-anchor tandem repeat NxxGxxAF-containing protein [Coleofasciculaceae cyanobacterium]